MKRALEKESLGFFQKKPSSMASHAERIAAKKAEAEYVCAFECNICRRPPVPYNVDHVARHNAGKNHKRMEELVAKKHILESWGIVRVEGGMIEYTCSSCDLKMELSFEKMEKHFHAQYKLPPPACETPTLEVTKVYRRKKYYEDEYNFDMDKINFILVSGSLSIEESTALSRNSVGILRRDVIPKCDIYGLYGMASILERLGEPIRRGKKISVTKMAMYGMFEHAQLGWFTQPYAELYSLSEKFVKKMAHYFEDSFPEVMKNFEKILTDEGLDTMDGHFGGTPFTSFAITRDYSCLPHDDPNDYGFGIIVWLYPSGELEVEEQPMFWFPEYKLHFRCRNGPAFICNANTTDENVGKGVAAIFY